MYTGKSKFLFENGKVVGLNFGKAYSPTSHADLNRLRTNFVLGFTPECDGIEDTKAPSFYHPISIAKYFDDYMLVLFVFNSDEYLSKLNGESPKDFAKSLGLEFADSSKELFSVWNSRSFAILAKGKEKENLKEFLPVVRTANLVLVPDDEPEFFGPILRKSQ